MNRYYQAFKNLRTRRSKRSLIKLINSVGWKASRRFIPRLWQAYAAGVKKRLFNEIKPFDSESIEALEHFKNTYFHLTPSPIYDDRNLFDAYALEEFDAQVLLDLVLVISTFIKSLGEKLARRKASKLSDSEYAKEVLQTLLEKSKKAAEKLLLEKLAEVKRLREKALADEKRAEEEFKRKEEYRLSEIARLEKIAARKKLREEEERRRREQEGYDSGCVVMIPKGQHYSGPCRVIYRGSVENDTEEGKIEIIDPESMNTKVILYILGAIILLFGGFFLFRRFSGSKK